MRGLDRLRTGMPAALFTPPRLKTSHVILIAILAAVVFTRFWRLGTPGEFYFDEVYFPKTAQEILHGDPAAWDFYGHENTHPPLSKLFMAGGMALFGENSFGWRFFGALAGVGAAIFIYLIGKRLFKSEFIGMAAAFLLTFDGLTFTQARIATPDTYVLLFVLGCVYFLLADRFLLSGVFLGAALASKWTALFTLFPVAIYFLYRYRRAVQGKGTKIFYLAPLSLLAFYVGTPVLFGDFLLECQPDGTCRPDLSAGVFGTALVSWMLVWALAPFAIYLVYRLSRSPADQEEKAVAGSLGSLPLFFVAVPLCVYLLTYLPMLLNGHDLKDVWDLNKAAYLFHAHSPVVAGPEAHHPYQSPWITWPITMRPVFFFVSGNERIYNLGNPIIFWFGLPALAFALWQGLKGVRARLDAKTGDLAVWGTLQPGEAALLFVVLTYLGFWLTWARQPRLMFLYHYQTALPFLTLALAYGTCRLWQEPWDRIKQGVAFLAAPAAIVLTAIAALFLILASSSMADKVNEYWARPFLAIGLAFLLIFALAHMAERQWQQPGGRVIALGFFAVVAVTFIYFYPQLAAWPVSGHLAESYYWFPSWR